MNTRFVITYINQNGQRQLKGTNQSRFHSLTKSEAEQKLDAFINSNTLKDIVLYYGKNSIGTFKVQEAECYPTGDLKSIYFNQ